jgi:cytosine/adenosine deaminase-related metal-dependent hydrolase
MSTRIRALIPTLALAALWLPVASSMASEAKKSARESVTAYVGASMLNPAGTDFDADETVIVRGAKIVGIDKGTSTAIPAGANTVRLNGRFIIPGLVNSHVHLATAPIPREARAYLRRELYSGVTMVRDMAGDARLLGELKREAAQDEIEAPDIYYAALFAGDSFFADPRTHDSSLGFEPGKAPWMQAVDSATDLHLAVARAKGTGATAIKLYADLPATLVAAITAEAHRQEMLVWSHAALFPARPSDVVEAGVDVMSHADFIAFESVSPFPQTYQQAKQTDLRAWQSAPVIDAVLSKMKEKGVVLDATVDVAYRYPVPRWPSSVGTRVAQAAYQRGIPLSAGTDDDADWNDPDSALLTEIERLVRDVGMTPSEALRAATVNSARTIGASDALAAGQGANFVVLSADPLRDIRNLRKVVLVVKHGIAHARSAYRPVTAKEMGAQ